MCSDPLNPLISLPLEGWSCHLTRAKSAMTCLSISEFPSMKTGYKMTQTDPEAQHESTASKPPAYHRKSSICSWESLQWPELHVSQPSLQQSGPLNQRKSRSLAPQAGCWCTTCIPLETGTTVGSIRFYHDNIVDHKKGLKLIHTKKIFAYVYTTWSVTESHPHVSPVPYGSWSKVSSESFMT